MIEKSAWLACSPERAFDLWVREISLWWPADRRHTGEADSTITIEPTGRFFERARDGREVELGRVLAWDRPRRIEFDFYPGTDPEHPTRAVLTFEPEAEGTRVTVVHRPTDASRDLWDKRADRFIASWDRVFAEFSRTL